MTFVSGLVSAFGAIIGFERKEMDHISGVPSVPSLFRKGCETRGDASNTADGV